MALDYATSNFKHNTAYEQKKNNRSKLNELKKIKETNTNTKKGVEQENNEELKL